MKIVKTIFYILVAAFWIFFISNMTKEVKKGLREDQMRHMIYQEEMHKQVEIYERNHPNGTEKYSSTKSKTGSYSSGTEKTKSSSYSGYSGNSHTCYSDPYDVYDYDSADEFADDVYEEFFDIEDDFEDDDEAYDAAVDYWEDHH